MSLIVPPPFAIPTPIYIFVSRYPWHLENKLFVSNKMRQTVKRANILPKNPLTVRTASKASTLGLRAVGICNNAKIEKQTRYKGLRPNVSLKGAKIRGPMPRRTTNPVVAPTMTLGVVSRSSAICAIPGVNMLEARGERTVTRYHQQVKSILGSSGCWRNDIYQP